MKKKNKKLSINMKKIEEKKTKIKKNKKKIQQKISVKMDDTVKKISKLTSLDEKIQIRVKALEKVKNDIAYFEIQEKFKKCKEK